MAVIEEEVISDINTGGMRGEYVLSPPDDINENKTLYSVGAIISGDDYQRGVRVSVVSNGRWTDISNKSIRCDRLEIMSNGKIRVSISMNFNDDIKINWSKETTETTN